MRKKTFFKYLIVSMVMASALMLFLFFNGVAFADEVEPELAVEESTSNAVLDWIKSLDVESVKGWIIALAAKAGIDTMLVISMLIVFIRTKVREARTDAYYQELIAKMNEEQQRKFEAMLNDIESKLDDNNRVITDTIKKQNSEKRELAKENVDTMRNALGEIKANLDN